MATPRPKFEPQKLNYFSDSLIICAVDFPIYFIESLSERHVVIAGGGGSSKTGVHNQINILELIPSGESCAAELMTKYQTPKEHPDAIMSGALMKNLPIVDTQLITGGTQLNVYNISFNSTRKCFSVTNFERIEDPSIEAEIKTICYTPGQFYTGGIDGQLSMWKVYGGTKKLERNYKAHTKEIDEIDFDPISQHLITLSRGEGRVVVWNLNDFKAIREFKKDSINKKTGDTSTNYNFRACRFASDATQTTTTNNDSFLLVGCNPIPVKGSSKIYKYSTKDYKQLACQQVTMDGIMAMTTSQDGKFVAIGTRTGGVSIFGVKNLGQIYKIESAHLNAVTKLEFLPSKQESLLLTNCSLCPLLSVSIDRRIVLHRPKKSSLIGNLCKVIFLVLVIYFMFFALHDYYLP